MNKNKRIGSLSLLLVLAIISLVSLVATFAKYTGEAGKASDTAQIAKWSVTMGDLNNKMFTHSYTENLITNAGADKIIAPGVGGSFEIVLTNAGDVTAKITGITFTETDGTSGALPIEYSLTGADNDWEKGISNLNSAISTKIGTNTTLEPASSSETIATVYWRWAYTGNDDTKDTTLGTTSATAATRTTYQLTMNVTAEQVEPTTT